MKKSLKKILAACVVTSVTLACAVSAFATGNDLTVDYDNETTFKASITNMSALPSTGQLTVLILDQDADEENVDPVDILYIDQGAAGTATLFQGMGLKDVNADTPLLPGTYKVKVGGDSLVDGIFEGTIVVSSEEEPEPTYFVWGDINGDENVTAGDAGTLVTWLLNAEVDTPYTINELLPGTIYVFGDINDDANVTAGDAGTLVTWLLNAEVTTAFDIGSNVPLVLTN